VGRLAINHQDLPAFHLNSKQSLWLASLFLTSFPLSLNICVEQLSNFQHFCYSNICFLFIFIGPCCSSFLCCPNMWLYVPRSVLWCSLWFPHKNDVQFVFSSSCLYECSCLTYVICVFLHIVLSNTYCVVYLLCSSCVLYALCCQLLWIVHFDWPLLFSSIYLLLKNTAYYCIVRGDVVIQLLSLSSP
jgi:hypothetical protein